LLLEEVFAPWLACCGSAADFLADKSSANFPFTESVDSIFVCEDFGVFVLAEFVCDPKLLGAELFLKFSIGDADVSEGVAAGERVVGNSLLDHFFSGDREHVLRRTCEGRLQQQPQHSGSFHLSRTAVSNFSLRPN